MESKPGYLKYYILKTIDVTKTKPIKEKHIRVLILGSFQDGGGATFWSVVSTIPIHSNLMIIWRFCYACHKLLREGHPKFIADSLRFKPWIASLGSSWTHGVDNFSKTVAYYCSLVSKRLAFHAKNVQFTGDLQLKEAATRSIETGGVDSIFQITDDIMDNLAEILKLQANVFSSGQAQQDHCQLAPLIPCIADSQEFLNLLIRLLTQLHSNVSINVAKLNKQRERFYIQYKGLRDFYKFAGSLVYFKQLIQVPSLSEVPPLFVQSEETSNCAGSSNPFLTTNEPTSAQILFINMMKK